MSNFRIYNDQLCPDLWDSAQHLDPEVRINLLRMAYDFYEKTNLPAPIVDVYLMGSIANYNWTADSDVDVHVIIDYKKLQMPEQTANKTVKTAGAQWNHEHNVLVKKHKVEMNLQNASEPKPYVTGIYSLVNDQWVRHPARVFPHIDRNVINVQYKSMKAYIENAIRSGDREQMKAAKKYLDAYRQYGLDTYGELSYENIIFKILRSRGTIKQLKDSIIAVYDRAMTVDEGDFIGSTFRNKVEASEVPDALKTVHDSHGMVSGNNSQNWRYLQSRNTILWNTQPSTKDKIAVYQWLTQRGIVSPTHRVMHKESMSVDETDDRDDKYKSLGKSSSDDIKMSGFYDQFMGSLHAKLEKGMKLGKEAGIKAGEVMYTPKGRQVTLISSGVRMDKKGEPVVLVKYIDDDGGEVQSSMYLNKLSYDKPVTEVGMKDLNQTLPSRPSQYKFQDDGNLRLDKLTLDNLFALREKAARGIAYLKKQPESNPDWMAREAAEFKRISQEIKRRMAYINKPINEMPQVSKKGKKVMAGDAPLKGQNVEKVFGNIVIIRQGDSGGIMSQGWTLGYFMDSEESAKAMKNGEMPYLMVPIGTFHSGGDPITDIWKKRFQKPGHEHILGVMQGHSDNENIFIDMLTVRPGYQRNHIAKLLIDRLRKTFPNAKITTSSRTDKGAKFCKGYGIDEGVGAGIPEDDRLNIHNKDGSVRRWQIRSKDAPKTPKMTDTPPKAIEEYDKPQEV